MPHAYVLPRCAPFLLDVSPQSQTLVASLMSHHAFALDRCFFVTEPRAGEHMGIQGIEQLVRVESFVAGVLVHSHGWPHSTALQP